MTKKLLFGSAHAALVAIPIAWILALYVVWLDHNDCVGALRQVGGVDEKLTASLAHECSRKGERLQSMLTWVLILFLCAEIAVWRALVHLRTRQI